MHTFDLCLLIWASIIFPMNRSNNFSKCSPVNSCYPLRIICWNVVSYNLIRTYSHPRWWSKARLIAQHSHIFDLLLLHPSRRWLCRSPLCRLPRFNHWRLCLKNFSYIIQSVQINDTCWLISSWGKATFFGYYKNFFGHFTYKSLLN